MTEHDFDRPTAKAKEESSYFFKAGIVEITDGDTVDAEIDLGFNTFVREGVRLKDIDTREIHFVSQDSEEYDRGIVHKEYVERWMKEAYANSDSNMPFVLYSHEYDRGAYGRVLGDFYSPYHDEWLAVSLFNEFDDVELYE